MSSSTSTTHSKRPTTPYILALFRRLFCSTTLPTSSDHNSTSSPPMDHHKEVPPNPGLMARLMGLETMPPNSITRTRSINSLERKSDSVSFRELPIFLEQEGNREFFVISFERSNSRRRRSKKNKVTKTRNDDLSTKRKIKYGASSIEKENMMISSNNNNKPCCQFVDEQCKVKYWNEKLHQKEVADMISSTRKMKMKMKNYIETGSEEDSSPVSVLHFQDFLFHAPISEVDSGIKESNWKRKLLLEDDDQPTSSVVNNKWKRQIWKMAEEDITETNWMYKLDMGKLHDEEENINITAGFEIEILHHLLNEMVQQLLDQHLHQFL